MSRRVSVSTRLRAAAVVTAVVLGSLAFGTSTRPQEATAASGSTGSAVTVQGTGEFASLKVTVSQTKNLVNQAVNVTWTGGTQTQPTSGAFGVHYLQIMQCWGDPAAGPKREQCQFGALADRRGGNWSTSRQANYGSTLIDPLETYKQPPNSSANVSIPFDSVDGERSESAPNVYFDASSTNELTYGRTRGDGTGEEVFELQTVQEAPGLGCGAVLSSGKPRSCFLVIVPRGDREVDNTLRAGAPPNGLDSSPLSFTNFAKALVVPLEFEPVVVNCDFDAERPVVGQEAVVEAVSRWQPVLCGSRGVTISYAQIDDGFARDELLGDDSGLSVVSEPLSPDTVPAETPVVYAPTAISSLVVGYNIERIAPGFDPKPEVLESEGSRVKSLKLTPRLVAKLLTQSYSSATPNRIPTEENPDVGNPSNRRNPTSLTTDPDFLALNPEFVDLEFATLTDPLVPIGASDAAGTLWRWIASDTEAREWVLGKPDRWGMKVNPTFGTNLDLDEFPKGDTYCQAIPDQAPLCLLDWRPYAIDFHDAARSVSRGDSKSRAQWDRTAENPSYKQADPLPSGKRGLLAITDSATALRFGLQAAELRNSSGAFVAPTNAGMAAAVGTATGEVVAAVAQPDVTTKVAAAYPLTSISYSAAIPAKLDPQAGKDYATFIRYATTDGQTPGTKPGTLPAGYLPLPSGLRAQAAAAATVIETQAGVTVVVPDDETPTGDTSGDTGATGDGSVPTGTDVPVEVTDETATEQPADTTLRSLTTPQESVGGTRFALAAAALLGLVAAITGPVLIRLAGRRGG